MTNYIDDTTRMLNYIDNKVKVSLNSLENAKYYGAVGDGVADDTEAIQRCIDANNFRIVIPHGVYRITKELIIDKILVNGVLSMRTNFELCSESATLLQDHTNSLWYCLKVNNCKSFHIEGKLVLKSTVPLSTPVYTVNPGAVNWTQPTLDGVLIPSESFINDTNTGYGNGFYTSNCTDSTFNNIHILGPFLTGIYLDTIPSFDGLENRSLSNSIVERCVTGIHVVGQYYTINMALVDMCRVGIKVPGGNNSVISSSINRNRIGIWVNGTVEVNSDHGKIIGCTLNHNESCGILLTNIASGFHISGCEIWATNGDNRKHGFLPFNLEGEITGTIGTSQKLTYFGIYMENVINMNIVGLRVTG